MYLGEYAAGTILKSGNGPYSGRLRLDQMTAIVIHADALGLKARDTYPGIEQGPFHIELVR